MHFGKQLRFLSYPAWKKRYIDFAGLKRHLKAISARLIAEGRVRQLRQKRSSEEQQQQQSEARPLVEQGSSDVELDIVEVELQRGPTMPQAIESGKPVQIAVLTPEAEEELLTALWDERDRVGDFFKEQADAALEEVIAITREAKIRRENGLPLAPLKKRCLDALVICEELCDFGRVNLVGFTKILKKIVRHTDFNRRVEVLVEIQQAPFVTMVPSVEEVRDRIKTLYVSAFKEPGSKPGADKRVLQELETSVSAARAWKLNTVLAQVDEHLQKARIVEHKKHVQPLPLAIGLVLYIILLFVPIFPASLRAAQRCLAMLVFGSVLWVSECVPLFVTAVFIIIVTPASYVLLDSTGSVLSPVEAYSEVFKRLFPSSVPLVLAGFSISQVFKKFGIDIAIASRVLGAKIVQTPRRFIFAVMFINFFLSMWISNIAAPVLTLTLIMPVLRDLPENCEYRKALLMATAISGNIGGMTTHIASPQNAVTVSLGDASITFIEFIGASFPVWPVLLVAGLLILQFWYKIDIKVLPSIERPSEKKKREHLSALTGGSTSRSAAAAIVEARHSLDARLAGPASEYSRRQRASLDIEESARRLAMRASAAEAKRKRLRRGRKLVFRLKVLPWKRISAIAIFAVSVILWIASAWLLPFGNSIGLISFIPIGFYYGTGLLTKDDFERLPWAIIMLLSGGNILGYAVESSGLLGAVANLLLKLPQNLFLLCFVTDLIMTLVSSFISSTVASLVLLPLAASIGASVGHARLLVMSAVITCSGAMAVPISCFPNINALSVEDAEGRRYLSSKDFLRVGGSFCVATTLSACTITYLMSLALGF